MQKTLANLRWWLDGFRLFMGRQKLLPFNTYVALYAMWTGLAGLFNWSLSGTLFNASLTPDLAALFNVMQLVAGLLIFFGIGWESEHFEGLGLVLLVTSAVVRGIASATLIGINDSLAIGIVMNGILLIPACAIRFYALWKGERTVSTASPHVITSVEELTANGEE